MSNVLGRLPEHFIIRPLSAADLTSVLRLTMLVREAPSWNYGDYRNLLSTHPTASAEASSKVAVPDAVLIRQSWIAERSFEVEAGKITKSASVPTTGYRQEVVGLVVIQCLRVGGSQGEEVETELESILVHPDARRLSIGSRLLEAAIDWCRQQRASILRLEVRSSNQPALSLYQRYGFHISGHRPGYYRNPDEDAALMELSIPPSQDP